MLKNYFKTAWRNLKNHRSYAAINIVGLAAGIATTLTIYVVIHYELNYDRFEKNKNSICRVVTKYKNRVTNEVAEYSGNAAIPLSKAIRNDIPKFKKVANVWNIGGAQIHIPIPGKDLADEKRLKQNDGLFFVEPDLFSMFDFKLIAGSTQRLNEPNTCVLNETLANTFFGDWQKAIGQTIQMWSFRVPLQVVGVFKDLPANTDLEVKMGASFETMHKINPYFFEHADYSFAPWPSECFVLLPEQSKPEEFDPQLEALVHKYFPPETSPNKKASLSLQPLKNIHLNEDLGTYKGDALTHKELWSLGLIGFFLLLVACVNFINLATAQSVNRAKEIGVRKVLGSSRTQILNQFLNETAVITTAAIIIGFGLSQLALPFISNLTRKPLSLNPFQNPSIAIFLVLLGIVVNFLAGFYPGLVLAGFKPIEAIKNKISARNIGSISLRKGLVVFQFVIAQLLIIGTIVVLQQMKFFRNQPMGFDKNAIAFIELPSDSLDQTKYPYLKEQMQKVPGVENAAFMMDAPVSFGSNNNTFYFNNEPIKKDFMADLQFADTGYTNLFHIPVVAGRIPYQTDTVHELLVNETLAKKLGFQHYNEILGKTLSFDGIVKFPIVGVMHDFNSKSLKQAVPPFVLATNIHAYNFIGPET